MELTVVIPSVGLAALLRTCVAHVQTALAGAGQMAASIVVVDNGSEPPYRAEALGADAALIRFDIPHSFAAACNEAARRHPANRFLFLNNDVLMESGTLAEMLSLLDANGPGICGARLVLADDTIQHCGVRFDAGPRGPFHIHHGRASALVSRSPARFQAVTGAAMLIDGVVFDRLGGFDEAYPFGYEDVDLCLRAGQLGVPILCAQSHDSLHFESMSNRNPRRHARSRRLFFERWKGRFTIDGNASQ